ncbi:60S ribosomal protein L31 [Candidatus Woesearchaeota archaeon]|nr:60S ribosomal protein L31 [Candidatus Woesearchaeota archaeon]
MTEKIFIIPLGREVKKVASWKKSKRGVRTVQRFLLRHVKRDVRMGGYLNTYLMQFGRRSAPKKVKVRVDVPEEKDKSAFAELFDAPLEKKPEIKKETKVEEKKIEAKVEEKIKPEIKKEEKKPEVKKEVKKTVKKVKIVSKKSKSI